MDDDLRKTFASKFEAFEAPVAEGQWNSIKDGIVQKPVRKAALWRRLSMGLILLLTIATSIWFLMEDVYADRNEKASEGVEKTTRQSGNASDLQPERDPASDRSEVVADEPKEPVNRSLTSDMLQSKDERVESRPSKGESRRMAESYARVEFRGRTFSGLLPIEIPPYEFQRDAIRRGPVPIAVSDTDTLTIRGGKTKFRPFLGLNLNYLNLRPNPGDNVYLTDIGSSVDLSLQQWGLSVGYEMTIPLREGLKLRNELNLSLRQHKVSFKYIADASDSENTEFLSVESAFIPLTLGISAGLLYDLEDLGLPKKELDLGIFYEPVIHDNLGHEALLRYPGSLVNLNMGLTFYPKELNWGIRVFGYYALNKKYSERALTMTPYGFGLQFLRDKARN